MDPLIVNRVFDEIDQMGTKMEKLSIISYQNSATLGILSKLVILIIGFLVIVGVTATYNMVSKTVPHTHKQESFVKEKTRVYPLTKGKTEDAY